MKDRAGLALTSNGDLGQKGVNVLHAPRGKRGGSRNVRIVGVGASAGGLEAFSDLLRNLPTDAGVAYVLVQHLDPTHRSLLSELLGRVTTLPVREIVDNSRVEPNQIYVIPPNCNLALQNSTLRLSPRKKNSGPARSIDFFLKSLAEDQKENAIAVILSGAASDGALGLKAVKGAGGLTFAQDENTAKYNSMPRAAAATGCVDFVLSPEKIAEELARVIRSPKSAKGRAAANAKKRREVDNDGSHTWSQQLPKGMSWPSPPTDIDLRKIFLMLRTKTGIDFTYYKTNTVRRRLQRRMAATKVANLEGYSQYLREHPEEIEVLYQDLLINVSSFFRNPASFELIKKKVYPKLAKQHQDSDPIRIWVAACSHGQEAYSLAMAYAEFATETGTPTRLQIFATDVNASVLEIARAGRYTKSQLEGLSPQRIKKFFSQEDNQFRVNKSIRDMVIFAQHNLLANPPFTRVDLVTCRNVLIYFDPSLQQRIIPTFHYAIKPDGFLWLGASESIGQFATLFETADKSHRLYVKKPSSSWHRLERPPIMPSTKLSPANFTPQIAVPTFNVQDAQKEADRLILSNYTPPSVLVDDNFEILQFRGDTSAYMELPKGKASFQLFKMAKGGLSVALQRLLTKAKKENKNVREREVRFGTRGSKVNVEVAPLKNMKAPCFLVLFEKPSKQIQTGIIQPPALPNGQVKKNQEMIPSSKVKQELGELREQLHSIQEEHETAVEELQASNEEVQSSNEELQSLNEELETSNEELESANEELTTLNEELATRNTELKESELRLREQAQLLEMAPLLARSPKDRIIFWSEGAERMYGFSKEEATGQIAHLFLNTHFYEPLETIQNKLMRTGTWEGEVEHRRKDGRILYIFAKWVAHHDGQNKLRAILEVNADITARKDAEKALKTSEEFNRSILENTVDSINVLDTDGRLLFMNSGGLKSMEIDDFNSVANNYWPNLWQSESRDQAIRCVREAAKGGTSQFQGACATEKGTSKWWDVRISAIYGPSGKPEKLLTVARDITEQKTFEQTLRRRTEELSTFFETATIGLHWVGPDGIIQWANPAELQMLGYSKGEYEGHHIAEFHADREVIDDILRRLSAGEKIEKYEARLRAKDGSLRDAVINSCVLWDDGKFIHTQSYTLDVTDQKRAEMARAERTRMTALRAEISSNVAGTGDQDSTLQNIAHALVHYLDASFARIWLVDDTAETLILKASAGMYIHLDGPHGRVKMGDYKIGRIAKFRRPHITNDVQNDPEISNPKWAKAERMVSFVGYPMIVSDEVIGVVAVFGRSPFSEAVSNELAFGADSIAQFVQRTKAEQKRAEAQEKLNTHLVDLEKCVEERTASLKETIGELEAFSYSVSHDLRTPLRAMQGYARALLEDCSDRLGSEHCGYLERIIRGADRLDRLTLDVLAYSRLSRSDLKFQEIDLNKLVLDVIEQYPQFEAAHCDIVVQSPLLPVIGHQAFLTQCIFNLIGNALKFVEPGKRPKVIVSTTKQDGKVVLSVKDNGIGIADDHRARVFQMFGRVHDEKSYQGTGIGLAVVKRAAVRMGGNVDFESELGKGTRFWIELPAVEPKS